ncbi:hypothetical protein ACWGHM_31450 [Streptomyces sp. NPDC054904]
MSARSADGRLEVFAAGADGIHHAWQQEANGNWSAWEPLGGPGGAELAIAPDADGRLEAFSLTPGGARLGHRPQVAPGGDRHPGGEFGEPGLRLAATPTADLDATGRTHVFAVTTTGALRTRVQDRPSGGWHAWAAFGDRAVAPLVSGSPAP